jgi:hypothetical protein
VHQSDATAQPHGRINLLIFGTQADIRMLVQLPYFIKELLFVSNQ